MCTGGWHVRWCFLRLLDHKWNLHVIFAGLWHGICKKKMLCTSLTRPTYNDKHRPAYVVYYYMYYTGNCYWLMNNTYSFTLYIHILGNILVIEFSHAKLSATWCSWFFRLLIRAFTGGATYMTTASAILEVATRGARQCWDSVKQSLFDCLKSCLLVCACYPLLPYELHLSGSKSNYQTFVWLLCTRNEIYQQQQQ